MMENRNDAVFLLLVTAVVIWVCLEFAYQRRMMNDLANLFFRLEDRVTHRFTDPAEATDAKRTV